jgi:hypothetical protein
MGRPPIGKHAMSDVERQRRHRERLHMETAQPGKIEPSQDLNAARIEIERLKAELARVRLKIAVHLRCRTSRS